jgi:hypothetical protein
MSERTATVALVAHLAELDARRLYLPAGFPSTFAYCTAVLRLSEGGACNRIEAARAARKFPLVLDLLEQGALNLTTTRLLAPHLTPENHEALLTAAAHKSRRQVEQLVADAFPRPAVASLIRKLPTPRPLMPPAALPPAGASTTAVNGRAPAGIGIEPSSAPAAPSSSPTGGAAPRPSQPPELPSPTMPSPLPRQPLISPLAADRYQVRFTATAATCEKLRLAQDLLRHAVPSGDPAVIFDRALTALLEDLARKKFGITQRPRRGRDQGGGSRNIPAAIKRAVVARDHGRCAFIAPGGRRCGQRAFLEFHHIVPYSVGGEATARNIQLRCRPHNNYEAELCFGRWGPEGGEAALRRGGARPVAAPNSSRDELAAPAQDG